MHIRRILTSMILAAALGVGGVAVAQDTTGVSSELERTANTTPQEKIAYAEAAKVEISDASKSIARLLENAKKDSDVEALQCLTSRLTAVKALLAVAENADLAMKNALASGESEKADHEFRKIAVALSKTRMLLAEAQRCGADQALASGDTLVELIDDGLIDPIGDDPGAIDDTDIGFDPPQASPFL